MGDTNISSNNKQTNFAFKFPEKLKRNVGNKKFPEFKFGPKIVKKAKHDTSVTNLLNIDNSLLQDIDLNVASKATWLKKSLKSSQSKRQKSKYDDRANKTILFQDDELNLGSLFNDTNLSGISKLSYQNGLEETKTKRKSTSELEKPPNKMIILDMTSNEPEDDSMMFFEDIEMNDFLKSKNISTELNVNLSETIDSVAEIPLIPLPSPKKDNTYVIDDPNISQMLSSTRLENIIKEAENLSNESESCNSEKNIINSLDINKSQLNKLFANSEDDFNTTVDEMQSSQRFLIDVKKSNIMPNSNIINQLNETSMILTNINNGSQYIQRQREIHNMDNEVVNDTLNSDLSQILKSSQYRNEVESVFNKCERTINNINSQHNIGNYSQEHRDALVGINDINWDQNNFPINNYTLNENIITGSPEIQTRPVLPSFFCNMGPFYGLPILVKSLIQEYKGINELYDWQKECLTLPAITRRTNLIYALPTSGGKTLVAEILIMREIICRQKNVILILPYVSIVQEKICGLSPFAVALNFLVEEYAAGNGKCPPRKRRQKKSIYICTIEKSMVLLDSLIESDRANEIGLIVIDEFHLLGDQNRGIVLESLLTKVMYLKAGIQIVGMSATIGNIDELAEFINADIYTREFRPIELREYIKCGSDILEINSKALALEDKFQFSRAVDFNYTSDILKIDPDHVAGLVMEVIPDASCLIFCHSKKNCENVAMLLCQVFQKKYLDHRKAEKINLMKAICRDTTGPLCNVLRQTIPYGVAYHHSGLITDERRHIEQGFRTGIICVICCTSTLAAGVNLPAQRVILRSPYIGRAMINLSKYKQMVGRAGRAGLGKAGESILICSQKDNIRVSNLLCSPMDEALSSIHLNNERGIRSLLLSAILLKIATTRADFQRLTQMTLMNVQSKRLNINMKKETDKAIEYLLKKKAIQPIEGGNIEKTMNVSVKILNTQEMNLSKDLNNFPSTSKTMNVIIKNSTELQISKLGKSSVRACIDLERSNVLYNDLFEAQKNLVLNDYLHLLYIVTPNDIAETINPDMGIYYSLFVKLNPAQQHTARILGINESCAVTMIKGTTFKPTMKKNLNRFFVALILYDLWHQSAVHVVAKKFCVDRGIVQNLMNQAASNASNILRFCEDLDEFWGFKELLGYFAKRLSHCCTVELMPLMILPSVKLGRARQLYNAGFKNLGLIAKSSTQELVESVEYLSHHMAKQLISTSKLLLLEKVETLKEEAQEVMDVLNFRK